jgi:hypothetical protein
MYRHFAKKTYYLKPNINYVCYNELIRWTTFRPILVYNYFIQQEVSFAPS